MSIAATATAREPGSIASASAAPTTSCAAPTGLIPMWSDGAWNGTLASGSAITQATSSRSRRLATTAAVRSGSASRSTTTCGSPSASSTSL